MKIIVERIKSQNMILAAGGLVFDPKIINGHRAL